MTDRTCAAARELAKIIEELGESSGKTRGVKTAVAHGIGVSVAVLLDYLSGHKRPKNGRRQVIQKWSRGRIRVSDWEFPEEQERLARTVPVVGLRRRARGTQAPNL